MLLAPRGGPQPLQPWGFCYAPLLPRRSAPLSTVFHTVAAPPLLLQSCCPPPAPPPIAPTPSPAAAQVGSTVFHTVAALLLLLLASPVYDGVRLWTSTKHQPEQVSQELRYDATRSGGGGGGDWDVASKGAVGIVGRGSCPRFGRGQGRGRSGEAQVGAGEPRGPAPATRWSSGG